jgi:hypothetical protein
MLVAKEAVEVVLVLAHAPEDAPWVPPAAVQMAAVNADLGLLAEEFVGCQEAPMHETGSSVACSKMGDDATTGVEAEAMRCACMALAFRASASTALDCAAVAGLSRGAATNAPVHDENEAVGVLPAGMHVVAAAADSRPPMLPADVRPSRDAPARRRDARVHGTSTLPRTRFYKTRIYQVRNHVP